MIQFVGSGGHYSVLKEIADLSTGNGWIIAVGDNKARKAEAQKVNDYFSRLFHPSSIISISAEIGVGTVIMAGAIIQANVRIGRHVIVNTGASVDHHGDVGDYVHIAPHATICGGVTIGEGSWIGAGAVVAEGVSIPPWAFVKAGSVIGKKNALTLPSYR